MKYLASFSLAVGLAVWPATAWAADVYEYQHNGNLVIRHAGLALRTGYRFATTFRTQGDRLEFKYTFQAGRQDGDELKEGRVYGFWNEDFQQFNITGASIAGEPTLLNASGRCELQKTGSPFSYDFELHSIACQVEFSPTDVMLLKAVVNTTEELGAELEVPESDREL